jgi:acetyl esterase
MQRRLFPGPVIDGFEPAPDISALLWLARLVGGGDFSGGGLLTPLEARQRALSESIVVDGPRRLRLPVEDLTIPGPSGPLGARLYLPPQRAPEPPPLIVYYHGGGWVVGNLDTHDSACRFLALSSGAEILSIDYRLAPEHPFPAAVEDSVEAFRWAVAEAAQLGADPARVAVCGDSAGGDLAAVVSLLTRDDDGPKPAMQALLYPVTDAIGGQESRRLFAEGFLLTATDMEWFEGHYLQGANADTDPRASVFRTEDLHGLPPAYICTAGMDPLRDEGEGYAAKLREAGNQVALRRHPGLVHTFANMTAVSRTARAAMHELAGALRMGLSARPGQAAGPATRTEALGGRRAARPGEPARSQR